MNSIQHDPTGVTQEGYSNTDFFSSVFVSFVLHLPPVVLAFTSIAKMVGPSLSVVDHEVQICVLTKLFSFLPLSTPRCKREKERKHPLSATSDEPTRRTRVLEVKGHLDHRGDRLWWSNTATRGFYWKEKRKRPLHERAEVYLRTSNCPISSATVVYMKQRHDC